MNSTQLSAHRLLAEGCRCLGLHLTTDQLHALAMHIEYLRKWNRRVNLTSILNLEQMIVKHVLDSLSISPYVRGVRLLDVGSGGGFPGLPLAIAHPHMQTVLLDSNQKKIEFLGHVAAQLALDNVAAAFARVEKYCPEKNVDVVTARAVGPLQKLVDQAGAFCTPGSRFLVMKGKHPKSEIRNFNHRKVRDLFVVELDVPFLNEERNLIVIEF